MNESNIIKTILLACSRGKTRLFRVNVGRAWTGSKCVKLSASDIKCVKLSVGDMLIENPRPFHSGVPNGFPDMFGWHTITITQDMVGNDIAVFVAIEAKSATGTPTEQQTKTINLIKRFGGRAGIARSAEDATKIIK